MDTRLVEEFMSNYKYCPRCNGMLTEYEVKDGKLVIECSYKSKSNKKGTHWDTELTEGEVEQALRKI